MRLKSQPESTSGFGKPLKQVQAKPSWRAIDLLSDLHLADNTPATVQALQSHLLHSNADAFILLGDIFEAWPGDDARHEGFEAQMCELLQQTSQRKPLYFMAGNRDFLLGPEMAEACGMQLLHDPCVLQAFSRNWLLSHGDAWCLADSAYQAFRQQVRSPAWQAAVLAQDLPRRRALAKQMREASAARQMQGQPELWADLDETRCIEELRAHDCQTLIHGHTHRPARHALGDGSAGAFERWVLSDWDLEAAVPRCDVLRLSAQGLQRRPPSSPPGNGH